MIASSSPSIGQSSFSVSTVLPEADARRREICLGKRPITVDTSDGVGHYGLERGSGAGPGRYDVIGGASVPHVSAGLFGVQAGDFGFHSFGEGNSS